MSKKKKQCEYVRDYDNGRCTHDAEPNSTYCIWHERVDGKKLDRIEVNKGSDLMEAYLKGADLSDSILQEVGLRGANLEGAKLNLANLQGAILTDANLQGADLSEANLQGASLFRANLQGASLGLANLERAELIDTSLRNVTLTGCRLDGSTLKYARSPITVRKKGRHFGVIADDHRILKNYFRVEGYYNEVSEHHYKERVCTRKAYGKNRRVWPWITNMAYELLCGYGEKPWRTVGLSFLFIFFYFLVFSILGMSIDQALLSSVLSFATLGFSAYMMESTPLQLLAASEALLGIFMMALLAFTFARKVER